MEYIDFDTTLLGFGKNTGIHIPAEVIEKLNAGRRPSLLARVNGYEYQSTPGVMKGRTLLSFSSQHRETTGLKAGDKIHVELAVALTPRKVEIPVEFKQALELSGTTGFFESLSNSIQRYHIELINSAKAEETKNKRIQKAIDLFKQGKRR